MMREDIRKERVEKYGSFLFCAEKETLCSFMDNEYGVCPKVLCILDDPEYIAMKKRIEANRIKNAMNYVPEETQTNIKTQNRTKNQIIKEKIEREEALAAKLFKNNKPNAAQVALNRAQILKGELK